MTMTEDTPTSTLEIPPHAQRYIDDALSFLKLVHEFDAADTSGPSGSRRAINSELAEFATTVDGANDLVAGVIEWLASQEPTVAAGVMVLLERAYKAGPGEAAESAVEAIAKERKASNSDQPAVEVDYTERNKNLDSANALFLVAKTLGGPAVEQYLESVKIPRAKNTATRSPSGPRFKGNFDFNWAGKRQATKLAEVQKATGLSGLELKTVMARANGVDPENEEKFKAFCADPPAEFSFTVNITLVKDQPPTAVHVTAVRQDSDDTPELEANSEADDDNGDDL